MSLDDWIKKDDRETKGKSKEQSPGEPVSKPEHGIQSERIDGQGQEIDTLGEEEKQPTGLSSLNTFKLTCKKCKYKRKLRITGDPRPHHLICKKCGSEMKK